MVIDAILSFAIRQRWLVILSPFETAEAPCED